MKYLWQFMICLENGLLLIARIDLILSFAPSLNVSSLASGVCQTFCVEFHFISSDTHTHTNAEKTVFFKWTGKKKKSIKIHSQPSLSREFMPPNTYDQINVFVILFFVFRMEFLFISLLLLLFLYLL